MPTPDEIVASLKEDGIGFDVGASTLEIGDSARSKCDHCGLSLVGVPTLCGRGYAAWVYVCIDRVACRQRRQAQEAARVQALTVVKL